MNTVVEGLGEISYWNGPSSEEWGLFGSVNTIRCKDNTIYFKNYKGTITLQLEGDCCSRTQVLFDGTATPFQPIVSVEPVTTTQVDIDEWDVAKKTIWTITFADGSTLNFTDENFSNGYYGTCPYWSFQPASID